MVDTREFTQHDLLRARNAITSNNKDISYCLKKVKDRLEYLKPLIDELNVKGYKLKEISHGLYQEYTSLIDIDNYVTEHKL